MWKIATEVAREIRARAWGCRKNRYCSTQWLTQFADRWPSSRQPTSQSVLSSRWEDERPWIRGWALEDDSPFWNKLDCQENKPLSKWKTFSYEYIVSRSDSFLYTDTRQLVLGNGLSAYLQQKTRQWHCIGIAVYFFLNLSTWQRE